MDTDKRKEKLRQEIMLAITANNQVVTGEVWLMLVSRTESELRKIAQDLHIYV